MKDAVRNKIAAILALSRDMTIATVRPDGAPQATVVSFVHDGFLIYFGCGAESQKAQKIAHDRRVSITVTAPYADWMHIQGLSMAGAASEVHSPSEQASVTGLMLARFPEAARIQQVEPLSLKLFRVRPSLVSILDYTQGFGHTDLVAIGADDITESRSSLSHEWAMRQEA